MISWKSMAKEKLPIPLFDPLRYLLFNNLNTEEFSQALRLVEPTARREQTEGTEELCAALLPFMNRWNSVGKKKLSDPSI